jgi:hypothetical protein
MRGGLAIALLTFLFCGQVQLVVSQAIATISLGDGYRNLGQYKPS